MADRDDKQRPVPAPRHSVTTASLLFFLAAALLLAASRLTPSIILEGLALVLTAAGMVSGILGLRGISNHRPAVIGIGANGLLLVLFIASLVREWQATRNYLEQNGPAKPHLGTWTTRTPEGFAHTWTFTGTQFIDEAGSGRGTGSYEIDYTKKPIWLTVTGPDGRMEMIVEFVGTNEMRVLGSRGARPPSFEASLPNVLVFETWP